MIRPLSPADLDSFIELRQKSIREEVYSFGANPQANINRENTLVDLHEKNAENFILGKFVDDQLVGMIGGVRHQNEKRQHRAWIWGMYMTPTYRGRGFSKQLLQQTIDQFSQLEGLEKVELSVTSQSPMALQLYQKFGFKEYGRQLNAMQWKGIAIDEIFMDLTLSA